MAGRDGRWQLQRDAMATANELNAFLSDTRIKISFSVNFGLLVDFPTGGTEIVPSLAQLWHVLERHGISVADPLEL